MALKDIGLRAKILIGVGIPMVLLVFLGYISISSLNSIQESEKWVAHTREVLQDAHEIVSLAVDMETGMRGYSLAGKDEFLAPYNNGKEKVAQLSRSLQETVSDNPAQVQRLEKVDTILAAWEAEVAEVNIALRRKIAGSLSTNDLAKMVGEAKGKEFFDRFRNDIKQFIDHELALVLKREAELKTEQESDELRKAVAWVTHTHEAISMAKDVLASAVDMETGMRGYLLTGKEAFLEPYKTGSVEFLKQTSDLAQFVADNPAQVQLISHASSIIKDWQREIVEDMISLRKDIGDAKNMEDLARLIGQAKGKTHFDAFRALIGDFVAVEEKLLVSRGQENADLVSQTNVIVITSIIVAVIVSLAAAFGISGIVLKQVGGEPNRIASAAARVADGDLTVQLNEEGAASGIAAAVRQMVLSIRDITGNISSATVNVTSALSEIAASISTQTAGASEQAAAINETTSTLEEIKSTSNQTLEKAELLGSVAAQARDKGQQGIQATNLTVDAMQAIRKKVEAIAETNLALSEQTKQIGEITGVVNNLSQQSKMLALNASIEAAKAWRSGQGFCRRGRANRKSGRALGRIDCSGTKNPRKYS
jgi:methyl-accepting chemotaxis protein